ncbi:non-ribosomal peptide synthetase, partial [Bacillus gaemokensis]
ELVRESIVVARENEDGLKQLCAYFVGDESLTVGQLREAMSQELPDYMIPSYFVQLAQMPLTPNGKIDRKALPEPEQNLQTGTEYVAPQTPIEEMLVSIWQTVLGVPQIGVLDNFFDLGGDSIKSIQVSSRLYQAGYRVDMKNLFKYSTVSSLSPHVEKITRVAEQGEVTGEAKLTPIQRWFFDREVTAPHHFNQAFMLYRKQGFDVSALRKTMQKIVEHHDALRMVFRQTEQGYEAWNRGIEEEELFSLEVMNLTGNGNPASAIEEAANVIQSSMHLSEGPLMKIALFQCEEGDHLLMVIHHLVVDGVSWRILLEDIGTGYEQAVNEEAIQLPQKTDSFQLWAEQLSLYANSSDMEKEREYWNEIEQIPTGLLPKDEEQDYGLIKDSEVITVQWTASETEQLLKQTNRAYNTEINDLLLTALGMAIHQWTGMENIAVNLEGHGRESILSDLDITRTVGWFTSQYPVVLPIEAGSNISHQIKNIKEGLRQIPHKGVGYGLLKYLSEHQEKQTFTLKPEISFNYLGQFDQDLENTEMQASPYSSGSDVSKYQARAYVLEINGMISDGRLSLGIGYNGKQYQRETIEQLANWLQASLQEVIEHCVTKERAELTPSDIIFKGMTIEALDRVVQETQHIGEIENVYPLTPMQKGMLFHSLLNSQSEAYFEQSTFDVQGNMNLKAFTQSLEQLVQRHAIFRTNFVSTGNDEPLQIVYRNRKIDFHYEDLHEMEEPLREEWVEKNTNKDRERGFNLAEDALMRMTILRTEEQTYRVIWSFHHILMDGWCMPLVIQEIFETYYATQQQREPELSVVTPYSDYIEWLEAQDHEEASKYWNEYLEGYEGQTLLPKENLKNEDEGYVLDELLCEFDRELTQKMKQVASDHQVTINSLIQTAWGALLQKYNGSQDVVFGSVVSGRPADIQGIENMIGLFINTIPVRIRCDAEESFVEVMKRNQKQAVASHAYDTHPLYEMQAQTEQKQDLITHLMVFENYPMETEMERVSNHSENLLEVKNANMEEQTSYNFNVIVVPGEEFKIRLNYNANVYDDASVERIRGHLIQVIKQVVNNPQICIQDLELVTAEEKMQIFEMFNDTATEYPCEKTIHQLFEEQVERTPDHVAVLFENQHLTYRELNERANQLARTLRGEGVQADQLVGIMVERSLEMIVGILGILKAGGAYVPIDPEYPEERIRYMLEDSGTKILLSQRHLQDKLSFTSKILFLDDEAIYHEDGSNLESKTGPNHLAYVIYTSGTTGNPKGILTTHRNIIRVVQDTNYISFSTQDKVLQLSSYAFDGSTFDIYGSLLNGSELILISKEVLLNMEKLTNYIVRENITVLFITTALFNVLVDVNINCLSNIRKVLFGGERVSVAHVRKAIQHIGENKIVHVYGPTESTVFATYYEVNEVEDKSENIPIGKPLSNTTTYIVNNNGHLQPIGVAGELWVGGSGLARSYLNRPELTSEKFVNNPFIPGERIYKTGDLVRWLSDGNIEYLGRIDQQVKIRGYRIELGEIEAQLLKIESVQEAIVVVRENDDGSKQLCAYFVANKDLTVRQIRETMSRELPDYMIPSYFVQLEQMPLTPNGKIDRKALPEPEKNLQTGTEYVAPQTPIEEMLVSIWQTVLGVPQIGVLDNFFDIGGDSIKAIQASSKLLQEGYKIEMKYWFKYQNIAELSLYVKPVTRLIDQKEVTGEVTLTPIQQWFFENKMEAPHHFNQAVMLYREQGFDVSALRKAMQKITEHHDALRMVFHQTEQGYEAWNRGIEEKELFSLEVMDFRGNVNPASAIEEAANAIQSSIHLSEGPLMKLGLFRCEEGEHLLIVIHHLVVDGVSWRILLEDIGAGYEQAVNGEAIQLPQKTDSFQLWAEQLSLYANNPDMEKEREYWNEVEQIPMELLPKDKEQDCGLIKDSEAIAVKWTKSETEQLLKQANNAYNTEINDLLLTALGMAVHQWTG